LQLEDLDALKIQGDSKLVIKSMTIEDIFGEDKKGPDADTRVGNTVENGTQKGAIGTSGQSSLQQQKKRKRSSEQTETVTTPKLQPSPEKGSKISESLKKKSEGKLSKPEGSSKSAPSLEEIFATLDSKSPKKRKTTHPNSLADDTPEKEKSILLTRPDSILDFGPEETLRAKAKVPEKKKIESPSPGPDSQLLGEVPQDTSKKKLASSSIPSKTPQRGSRQNSPKSGQNSPKDQPTGTKPKPKVLPGQKTKGKPAATAGVRGPSKMEQAKPRGQALQFPVPKNTNIVLNKPTTVQKRKRKETPSQNEALNCLLGNAAKKARKK
jgi:hypothetical protein